MFVVLGHLVRWPTARALYRPIVELFFHRNVGVGRGVTSPPDVTFTIHTGIPHILSLVVKLSICTVLYQVSVYAKTPGSPYMRHAF